MKIIFFTLCLILITFISSASAQMDLDFGADFWVGYFQPVDSKMDSAYGGNTIFGGDLIIKPSPIFEVLIGGSYYKRGDITISPILGSVKYRFSTMSIGWTPYIGAGGGNYLIKENWQGNSNTIRTGGLHCFGGTEINVGEGISMQMEIRYTTLKFDSKNINEEIDAGGIIGSLGVKF